MNYNVLGICSGLGVSLFPFKDNCIGNIEPRKIFHTPGNEQWKLNFGEIPLYQLLPAKADYFEKEVDVIISSPDCGSGSILRLSRNKALGNHNKNHSLLTFFQSVKIFKPKFFYFENLEGLFKSFPLEDFKQQVKDYRLVIYVEPVSSWGNSQKSRKRLVIIGIRKYLPKKLKKFFKLPTVDKLKTCKQLYGDLVKEDYSTGNVRENIDSVISIHAKKRMSLREIQKHWLGRLKGKKRWETEPGFNFSTAPGVYRNMDNDYPATARKANRQYSEDGLTLTPRQLARVQGIPDEFKLYMDENKIGYCINKARTVVTKTPPMEISYWFKKCINKSFKYLEKC